MQTLKLKIEGRIAYPKKSELGFYASFTSTNPFPILEMIIPLTKELYDKCEHGSKATVTIEIEA